MTVEEESGLQGKSMGATKLMNNRQANLIKCSGSWQRWS
jgi:hypothetical protein